MTILQIECFVEAVKQGSMSKAATQLFISQQSVSKHIHSLEMEVGFPLLERHNMGVLPTVSGKILFEVWEKNVYEHRIAIDRAKDKYYESQNTIRIGLLDCGGFHDTIVSAIMTFNEQFPDLNIEYEFLLAETLFQKLEIGTLDFVFVYRSELMEKSDYHILDVCKRPIQAGLYVSRKSPIANRRFHADLLKGQVFGVLNEEGSRDYRKKTEEFLKNNHLEKDVELKFFSERQNLGIALATRKCVSIGYETMYEHMRDKLAFLPIPELKGSGRIVLVWKNERFTVKGRTLANFILDGQKG